MYAVIALFDKKTEEEIKGLWSGLRDEQISSYAYEVPARQPHLTIASYKQVEVPLFIETMQAHYQNKECIPFVFSTLGTFIHSGTLFLAPTISVELREFHLRHHFIFKQFDDDPASLYLPDFWVPHCTLANRLTRGERLAAYEYCSEHIKTYNREITGVAFIHLVAPNDVRTIHKMTFKKST
ncbi:MULTISPECIES: 2'-5' RNA ligase family protein [Exiguobacterium]|uniref:2'-5' RNA ligase family protein n=1 Tax=Exiguobacterium TaxID=33986 RepID=UPI001BE57A97|nr:MULTISPECIES: 2'-5' RNA ligase family protein [Exiguobacterium]MCT4784502.1 2'-5' RNA ligase family protein [Exiguobacterium himgiriensis]